MLTKNEIKYLQSLRLKKFRLEHSAFIVEGPKIVTELMHEKPKDIISVYALQEWAGLHANTDLPYPVRVLKDFELEKISSLQNPPDVLALVKMMEHPFTGFKSGEWQILLDNIQDPGNMGTILRIADWFGIRNIYATSQTVDIHNSKVVQSAMGSIWRVNVTVGPCQDWLELNTEPVYGAQLTGLNVFEASPIPPGILVIGNEGHGISPEIGRFITQAITIPRLGQAESLNAAVAAGIMVSQLLRPALAAK